MAIRVTDLHGEVFPYDEDDTESGELYTEDVHNNLVVKTDKMYAVYAEGQWAHVEQDAPPEATPDG